MPNAMFIRIEVDPQIGKDPALAKKLAEVCPVNIFAQNPDGSVKIVDENLDECVLCELCVQAAPPGAVVVYKEYDPGAVLRR